MNIPNKITVSRLCLVPLILSFLLIKVIPNRYIYSMIFFLIASFTDYIDGYLARKNGLVTNFGKFLDPVCDKILIISVMICFVELGLICSLPVILITFRELMVTSLRMIAVERGRVISANCWGKIKTISQMTTILLIMTSNALSEINLRYNVFEISYINLLIDVSNVMLWLSTIITIFSGLSYVYSNRDCIN